MLLHISYFSSGLLDLNHSASINHGIFKQLTILPFLLLIKLHHPLNYSEWNSFEMDNWCNCAVSTNAINHLLKMIFRHATNTKIRIIQLLSVLSIEMYSTGLVKGIFQHKNSCTSSDIFNNMQVDSRLISTAQRKAIT